MRASLLLAAFVAAASAFEAPRPPARRDVRLFETVRVKFRIHPGGRIEETVSGIKGTDCTKVTEELNEKLGKVMEMKPTAEMFEQKVEVEETNTASVYDSGFSEW
mmetsp:Transcript_21718/g.65106  ORF Transcript_21718/g.65106 Transcript_21718/m.65106 type:complete len:105 (+) Transcript_21718:1519-1833(+)